jgi:hypothetical protein
MTQQQSWGLNSLIPSEMKLCKNCIHSQYHILENTVNQHTYKCHHPIFISPVDGEIKPKDCHFERTSVGFCKPAGSNYTERT